MGCGALCGDSATIDTAANLHSKAALEGLLLEVNQNKDLARLEPYSSFLQKYHQDPYIFYLKTGKYPAKDEEITQLLRTKWKVLILDFEKDGKNYCDRSGLNSNAAAANSNNRQELQQNQDVSLIYHKQFIQIEKDLERTFSVYSALPISQMRMKQFENILKRITNHFPKMGYTQGINFIVSYLLVIGYSQNDSFEIFVHLATSKRFLLLGMYENHYPLYQVLLHIFQKAFKRINPVLYSHIFQSLEWDTNMWFYRWLTTFYITTFPKEIIKYVWDFVILVGSYGIVIIAISLLSLLQPLILEFQEFQDLNKLFLSLQNLQTFNQHINLHQLISKAFETELENSDFDNLEKVDPFYGSYLKTYFKFRPKKVTSTHKRLNLTQIDKLQYQSAENLLKQWRKQLVDDRLAFKQNEGRSKQSNLLLHINSAERSLISQSGNEDLEVVILYAARSQSVIQVPEQPIPMTKTLSAQSATRIRTRQKVQYLFNEINQKVQQQQQSVASSNKYKPKMSHELLDLDELDKLQLQFNQTRRKPISNTSNLMKTSLHYIQKEKSIAVQVNNFNVNQSNSLSLAGQVSLKNMVSYDAISISSKRNSNKSSSKNIQVLKVANQKSNRICGCKNKTEENRCESVYQTSELEESKYQFSDKDSASINNYSHNSQINDPISNSVRNVETHRERVSTHADFMINSHCPAVGNIKSYAIEGGKTETDIEVMVLQFKKNKRARVNIVTPSEPPKREAMPNLRSIGWEHEQQSIESIHQLDSFSQVRSNCSHLNNQYEIESIK